MGDEVENEDDASHDAPRLRGRHIRKRALKNKALSVTFDEKELRDFVTGFHKRKKKRRKEAQKQQEQAQRRKRIEQRKKRKLEKELAYYDGGPPSNDTELDGNNEHLENDEETQPRISTSAMAVYDDGDVKVTVKTSEIAPDEENDPMEKTWTGKATGADKGHSVPVNKKSFKRVVKHKPERCRIREREISERKRTRKTRPKESHIGSIRGWGRPTKKEKKKESWGLPLEKEVLRRPKKKEEKNKRVEAGVHMGGTTKRRVTNRAPRSRTVKRNEKKQVGAAKRSITRGKGEPNT